MGSSSMFSGLKQDYYTQFSHMSTFNTSPHALKPGVDRLKRLSLTISVRRIVLHSSFCVYVSIACLNLSYNELNGEL